MEQENSDDRTHRFTGWQPSRPVSPEVREILLALRDTRQRRLGGMDEAVDSRAKKLEVTLVPTCACGWRGGPEDWIPWAERDDRGGLQFLNHRRNEDLRRINEEYAASVVASALRLAADAWDGDPSIADWLNERADHIKEVGRFDGKDWP